jgi:hypothetical protein
MIETTSHYLSWTHELFIIITTSLSELHLIITTNKWQYIRLISYDSTRSCVLQSSNLRKNACVRCQLLIQTNITSQDLGMFRIWYFDYVEDLLEVHDFCITSFFFKHFIMKAMTRNSKVFYQYQFTKFMHCCQNLNPLSVCLKLSTADYKIPFNVCLTDKNFFFLLILPENLHKFQAIPILKSYYKNVMK